MSLAESFVCETSSAPGSSTTITLLGAAAGLPVRTFLAAGYVDGDRVYYKMTDNSALSEEGIGTYHPAGPTLTRDTVVANTSGTTSRLNFTGTTYVFAHPVASRLALFDINQDLTLQRNLLYGGGAMLRSHLAGLNLSRSDATTLGISAGICLDSTNVTPISFTTAWTKKTAGSWASGTTANGMGQGLTIASGTWYHVFAVIVSGSPDIYFDTSVSAANAPVGTTAYRRIGSFKTDASAQIIDFSQFGDEFMFVSEGTSDISTTSVTDTASLLALSRVPSGVTVLAKIRASFSNSGAAASLTLYSPAETTTPTSGNVSIETAAKTSWSELLIRTNTAQQINAVSTLPANNSVVIFTTGWVDYRGRFD